MFSTTLRNGAKKLLKENLRDEAYFLVCLPDEYKILTINKEKKGGFGQVYRVKTVTGEERAVKQVKLNFEQEYGETGSTKLTKNDATLLGSFFGCVQECLLKDTFESPYIVKVYRSWIQPSNQTSEKLLAEDVEHLETILQDQPQSLNQNHKEALERIKGYSIFMEMDWYDMSLRQYQDENFDAAKSNWKKIAQSIDSALGHMRMKGWAHRDLKPRNILVNKKDGDIQVAICDFGDAIHYDNCHPLDWKNVGTIPYNSAPEVLSSAFDMWSFGLVILRLFYNSESEFSELFTEEGKLNREKLEKCREPKEIDSEAWEIISSCLQDNIAYRGKAGCLPGLDMPSTLPA